MKVALLGVFPLHVLPGCEPYKAPGHVATWLVQLCEAYAQAPPEFEFHWLFFSRRLRTQREPLRWRGQYFHVLPATGRLRMLRGYRGDVRAFRQRLGEIQPDLVHAWGTEEGCALAAAGSGFPWLLSMQGILTEYIRRVPMHPFVRLQSLYERYALRQAREVTVESHWGARVLQPLAPHARVHLVEYGVQELFYRTEWEPDPARPVALYVGTLDRRKGVADLVAAFADPALRACELHLAGEGPAPFVEKLRAQAGPNVRWLGRLNREQTAAAMSRAWCLALPTYADTSPNVVKEARVLGLPVVTTPAGGQSDYIFDGENGFLAEPGHVEGLRRGLRALLTDLARTRAHGAERWPEQREFFRPEHTAEKFQRLYRQLAR